MSKRTQRTLAAVALTLTALAPVTLVA